jgi:hypothetical protein
MTEVSTGPRVEWTNTLGRVPTILKSHACYGFTACLLEAMAKLNCLAANPRPFVSSQTNAYTRPPGALCYERA